MFNAASPRPDLERKKDSSSVAINIYSFHLVYTQVLKLLHTLSLFASQIALYSSPFSLSASGDAPACSAFQLVPNAVKMTHFQTEIYSIQNNDKKYVFIIYRLNRFT